MAAGHENRAGTAIFFVASHNNCCAASSHPGPPRNFISGGKDPGGGPQLAPQDGQIPCINYCRSWESHPRAGAVCGPLPTWRPTGPRYCDAQQIKKFWLVGDRLVLYIWIIAYRGVEKRRRGHRAGNQATTPRKTATAMGAFRAVADVDFEFGFPPLRRRRFGDRGRR